MKQRILFTISITILATLFSGCSGGGSSDEGTTIVEESGGDPAPSSPTEDLRIWTVSEILAEEARGGAGGAARCGGEFGFKRCICAGDVPSYVRYRPAVVECNGNAAAILSGRLLDSFSVVVRDTQNRDRWPAADSGFGGCTFEEANAESPPARCSAFKVQDKFITSDGSARVHCFGASGYSEIFADAARLTVKLSDDPFSNDDDIERYCLNGATNTLN